VAELQTDETCTVQNRRCQARVKSLVVVSYPQLRKN